MGGDHRGDGPYKVTILWHRGLLKCHQNLDRLGVVSVVGVLWVWGCWCGVVGVVWCGGGGVVGMSRLRAKVRWRR